VSACGERHRLYLRVLVLWGCLALMLDPSYAAASHQPMTVDDTTKVWTDFRSWHTVGVVVNARGLALLCQGETACPEATRSGIDPYPPGGYHGHDYYNGGRFLYGWITSPPTPIAPPFTQAVASWDATTPRGTWLEMRLRVRVNNRWTRWYVMGVWALGTEIVVRHSADSQQSTHTPKARVDTDTLILQQAATALQLRVVLFTTRARVSPTLRLAAVTTSDAPANPTTFLPGNPQLWGHVLSVPEISQRGYSMGDDWCSPTSMAMVMAYWAKKLRQPKLDQPVPAIAAGVNDWHYGGTGNWPFNTAYAGAFGLRAYVARLPALAAVEQWVAQSVPVIISFSWKQGELDNAAFSSSDGHLAVIVGFDRQGNPIVNDPGGIGNAVQRIYPRAQLEHLWLATSAGTVYLIYPQRLIASKHRFKVVEHDQ
jgi:hypothetical protein